MRGVIENTARKQQINDFRDLRFGNITPTDLDGMIEYHDKAYAILELKYDNADLPRGQRLSIERLVADVGKSGKKAIAAVIEHNVHDTSKSIPVAQCRVREIYLSNERAWRPPIKEMTALELLQEFFDYVDRKIAI